MTPYSILRLRWAVESVDRMVTSLREIRPPELGSGVECIKQGLELKIRLMRMLFDAECEQLHELRRTLEENPEFGPSTPAKKRAGKAETQELRKEPAQ